MLRRRETGEKIKLRQSHRKRQTTEDSVRQKLSRRLLTAVQKREAQQRRSSVAPNPVLTHTTAEG